MKRGTTMKQYHNIQPIYNKQSRILILGSFPSVKSREAQFFYHHPQNRFWKILATLHHHEPLETIEAKKAFLLEHHIALWDVIESCQIKGSSDSSIEDVVVNDIHSILQKTQITHIYTNGKKHISFIKNTVIHIHIYKIFAYPHLLQPMRPSHSKDSLKNGIS